MGITIRKQTLEAVTLVRERDGLAAGVVNPLVLTALLLKGCTLPKKVRGARGIVRVPKTKLCAVGTPDTMMSR